MTTALFVAWVVLPTLGLALLLALLRLLRGPTLPDRIVASTCYRSSRWASARRSRRRQARCCRSTWRWCWRSWASWAPWPSPATWSAADERACGDRLRADGPGRPVRGAGSAGDPAHARSPQEWDKVLIAVAAFVLLTFTKVNPAIIILGAAALGFGVYR